MEKRQLTCIRCPLGCQITVTLDQNQIVDITGNTCPRGKEYAQNEILSPMRMVTSIVRVNHGDVAMAAVKTAHDIPKGKIFEVLEAIRPICIEAPVHIGDVIVENVADTGVDVIATKNVVRREA